MEDYILVKSNFNSKQIDSDSVLSLQFQNASRLLSDFRQGIKNTKQVFDIERLSSLFALNDLFKLIMELDGTISDSFQPYK